MTTHPPHPTSAQNSSHISGNSGASRKSASPMPCIWKNRQLTQSMLRCGRTRQFIPAASVPSALRHAMPTEQMLPLLKFAVSKSSPISTIYSRRVISRRKRLVRTPPPADAGQCPAGQKTRTGKRTRTRSRPDGRADGVAHGGICRAPRQTQNHSRAMCLMPSACNCSYSDSTLKSAKIPYITITKIIRNSDTGTVPFHGVISTSPLYLCCQASFRGQTAVTAP